jgi:hypothetical protein
MRTAAAGAKQPECVQPKISLAEINPADQSSNGINVSVSGLNDFLTSFYPTDAWEKMSRACGIGARWHGSGHGYYLTAEVLLGGKREIAQNVRYSFPGRAAG